MAPVFCSQCRNVFPNPQKLEKHRDKCMLEDVPEKIQCPHSNR